MNVRLIRCRFEIDPRHLDNGGFQKMFKKKKKNTRRYTR